MSSDFSGLGPTLQVLTKYQEVNKYIESIFSAWAKKIKLADKLRIIHQSKKVDGEAFGIFVTNPLVDHPVKLDLLLVESDQVTSPYSAAPVADWERVNLDGIVLDSLGNVIGYEILRYHPGDYFASLETNFYPRSSVCHWFRADRPGQIRGVPEITAALPLFAQMRRYTLATLSAAEIAANFALMLETDSPADGADEDPSPLVTMEVDRGMMTAIPAGWAAKQLSAEQPTTTYSMFKAELLKEIGKVVNVPYNVTAGDSSAYNFSSARMDSLIYRAGIRCERRQSEDVLLDPLFSLWFEEASLIPGVIPQGIGDSLPHAWVWPGFEYMDPQVEAEAEAKRLENGTTTMSAVLAERGLNFADVVEARAREKEVLEGLGLPVPGVTPEAPEPAAPVAAKGLRYIRAYDENQERDESGRWTDGGGGGGGGKSESGEKGGSKSGGGRGSRSKKTPEEKENERINKTHDREYSQRRRENAQAERQWEQSRKQVSRERGKEDRETSKVRKKEDQDLTKKRTTEDREIQKSRAAEDKKDKKEFDSLSRGQRTKQRGEFLRREFEKSETRQRQDKRLARERKKEDAEMASRRAGEDAATKSERDSEDDRARESKAHNDALRQNMQRDRLNKSLKGRGRRAQILAYDEDQERDENGRFASEGGGDSDGGESEDTPEESERDFEQEELDSERQFEDEDEQANIEREDSQIRDSRDEEDNRVADQRSQEDDREFDRDLEEDSQIYNERSDEDTATDAAREAEDEQTDAAREAEDERVETARAKEDARIPAAREKEEAGIEKAREKEDSKLESSREKEDSRIEKENDREESAMDKRHEKEESRLEDSLNDREADDATWEKERGELISRQIAEKDELWSKQKAAQDSLDAARESEDEQISSQREKEDQDRQSRYSQEDRDRDGKRNEEDAERAKARQAEDSEKQSRRQAEDSARAAKRQSEDEVLQQQREQRTTEKAARRSSEDAARNQSRAADDSRRSAEREAAKQAKISRRQQEDAGRAKRGS